MISTYGNYIIKGFILSFLLGLVMIFFCFRPKHLEKTKRGTLKKMNTLEQSSEAENYDSLFACLIRLENAIEENPDSSLLTDKILKTAFDAISGQFFVVGKGINSGEFVDYEIELITQKQMARRSAEEWALFLKAFLKGDDIVYGTEILGKVMYAKKLVEEIHEDTVYQLFAIPITSVVVW